MNIDTFIAWLGVMLPLMISPGPANIVLAGAGVKQGVKNSIPLIIGLGLGNPFGVIQNYFLELK